MRALKTAISKKFDTINKCFWLTSIQGLPYMKTKALGFNLVYSFINFIILLPVTYARHSGCNCKRLANRLSKYRGLLDYFGQKIAEALPS